MIAMIFAAMLQATAATGLDVPAPPEPPKPSLATAPDWLRRPTGADLARNYPRAAIQRGLAGREVMQCTVAADGGLFGCEILEESPADAGFGEATLKMSSLFKMRPMTKDGQPVAGGKIRIPLRFVLPGEASIDPMSAMLACYGQTAAASESDSSNEEMIRAYSFFAAQAAVRNGEARAKPSSLETSLAAARLSAQRAGPRGGPGEPSLQVCLSVYRQNAAKAPAA